VSPLSKVLRLRSVFTFVVAVLFFAAALTAEAQPAGKVYRISFLGLTPGEESTSMKPLLERLRELGYSQGKNMMFESLSAEGRPERLPQLAREVVRARPDVLIAGFGTLTAQAAKAATTTIPIVFTLVGDPVGAGLVASIGRPGGNVTGLSGMIEIGGKQLQLLRELAPGKQVIAVLMNPDTPFTRLALKEINAAAETTRTRIHVLEARTADQVPRQFEAAITTGAAGLIVLPDPLIYSLRRQIADLAAKARLPAMFSSRDYAEEGGLISYGANRRQIYRRAAEYVDRILKGAKPADLPIELPTKFELIINQRAAKALGITIPPAVLAQADDVIE
jgi:putative ABC transport system substrate-binding protein